ncbi:MAG: carboxypeptidase-like regulatory domain-containing protein, partial [Thermoanaerobaculia bacterium]
VVAAVIGYEQARNQMFDGPPGPPVNSRSLARSGPDGRFAIRLPEAEIRVTASKKGLPTVKSESLKIAAGEKRRGVTIVMPLGYAVTGKVTDGDGRPLSGVAVTADEAVDSTAAMFRRSVIIGARAEAEETVESGSDGTFTIRLKEGKYDVAFRREGWASNTVPAVAVSPRTPPLDVTMQPSVDIAGRVVRGGFGVEGVSIFTFSTRGTAQATTGADGSFVLRDVAPPDLSATTGTPVQLQLTKMDEFIRETRNVTAPASNAVIELSAGGRVSGRVIDKATRAPITTFQAGLAMSRSGGGMSIIAPPQQRNISSDDGSFTLGNVPAGVVSIVVNAPGYVSGRSGSVTLEEGKSIENVEVELDRGVRLTGRVTAPDGSGVANAYVREMGQRSVTPTAVMTPSATTDGNGEYAIEAIEPGEKMLEFAHREYATVQKAVKLSDRETRLDVQFEGGAAAAGVVVNDSGSPVAGAVVRAAGGGFGQVQTETDGSFRFTQLRPGRYTFTASGAGLAPGTVRDVDVPSAQPIRITMPAGSTIYGRVSGATPAELQRTTVMVSQNFGSGSLVDASGNYRLQGVPTGKIRVNAMVMNPGGPGKLSPAVEIDIAPGESRQVDLEFRSGATMTGRVTRGGQPLPSATVSFRPKPPAQTFASAPTNEQGVYTVSGLEDGEYSVHILDMQRLSPASQSYTVRGSGTFDIDLKSVTVRGRVINSANGGPVREPRIMLRPEGSDPQAMMSGRVAMGDANGTFIVDFVAPGRYSAAAEKEGFSSQPVDITVSEGGSNEIELKLAPADAVKVRVVDARDGKVVTASIVTRDAQGRSGQSGSNYGNPSGEVTLYLPPGTHSAIVSANGYASRTITLTSPGGAVQTVALSQGGTIEVKSTGSTSPTNRRARLLDAAGAPYGVGFGFGPFPLPSSGTTLRNIAPGNYTLQILGEGDAVVASAQVTVVAGQTAVVSI